MKKIKARFFNAWTLQGLWVFITALAVFTANLSGGEECDGPIGAPAAHGLTVIDLVGFCIWLFGFTIEVRHNNKNRSAVTRRLGSHPHPHARTPPPQVVADRQKTAFKKDPLNKGRWIDCGLWGLSRHPNYCGEIMLWCGIFVAACRCFHGTQWAAVVSPLFVALLIIKLSGIPPLEKLADERWGQDLAYIDYKKRTPVLLLNPCVRPAQVPQAYV